MYISRSRNCSDITRLCGSNAHKHTHTSRAKKSKYEAEMATYFLLSSSEWSSLRYPFSRSISQHLTGRPGLPRPPCARGRCSLSRAWTGSRRHSGSKRGGTSGFLFSLGGRGGGGGKEREKEDERGEGRGKKRGVNGGRG